VRARKDPQPRERELTRAHARIPCVYPSACVVARCQIDAVCHCSKPQSARLYRDDPNTRALSSSHYGYVLSAGVFRPASTALSHCKAGFREAASVSGLTMVSYPEYCQRSGILVLADKLIECSERRASATFVKFSVRVFTAYSQTEEEKERERELRMDGWTG